MDLDMVNQIYDALDVEGYGVIMELDGASKIRLIKTLRDHLGLSLLEAKVLVERSGDGAVYVVKNIGENHAQRLAVALRNENARATVVYPIGVRPTPVA